MKLGTRLTLYNLFSKLVFVFILIVILPYAVEKITNMQTDRELVQKREKIMSLISETGIEPFISEGDSDLFASFNILKEEFISIEKNEKPVEANFIEVTQTQIDEETIDFRVLNYSFNLDGENYLLQIGKSIPKILYVQKNIKEVILVFLVSFILLALVSDLYFLRRTISPLKLIISKLRKTSSPALFDPTPVKTGISDFIQLDKTITELMKKIDTLFSAEKQITVNISHELLTPVSVLRSRLENLLLQEKLDEDSRGKVEESLKTIHRLKTLINSFLLVSRIESRQFVREDTFEIKELIDEITEELNPLAEDKGIQLKKEVQSSFILYGANRPLIFSMFYNVLNNAIQNTGSGGFINIKSCQSGNRQEFCISDNGPGMTGEQLSEIFNRFRKRTGYSNGRNGIGLAITKSIADFHNISVKIDSKQGEGTNFFFTFPENS